MASTSLAEQLRRLATPQTAQIVDSKKRASILFDAKEAANKDREIIYDIGLSGLQELASLNPAFQQFEQTLFDRSARDLVRSVESTELNAKLNKTIKRFLIHLSPHFLLQPTYKCLEWLIRRFQIHEFNVDDFLMLILPYHETRMFIRCIQILNIRDTKNRWNWLHPLQKPGISLSKQVLFNRTATDAFLLKTICKHTQEAVKELDLRAYTLQSWFAFFCTTLLGMLESTDEISEKQISGVFPVLAKGISSQVMDFCAASMMVVGYLVTKAQLAGPILEVLVQRVAKITHPGLQTDAIVLLVLCYQNQAQSLAEVSEETLEIIVANKWVPSALSKNYAEKISIIPFALPLLSATLKVVQLKGKSWKSCKTFIENLLLEITFAGQDAEAVIRCIFDAYVLRGKPEPSDVITIDSDEEEDEIELTDTNIDINHWYSDLLKSLERQYPLHFEKITKEVMRSADKDGTKSISKSKRRSLKTVLGFLFTAACTGDGANIFENLYHHNVEKRVGAMKYLVQNLNNSGFSDDSKNLLRDSIAERLADESPLVVLEALRFDTQGLVQMLERDQLIEKLKLILTRGIHNVKWSPAVKLAISHITSALVCDKDNYSDIFYAVWPYLFPSSQADVALNQHVIESPLKKFVPLLKVCEHSLRDSDQINQLMVETISKNGSKFGNPEVLLATVQKTLTEKRLNTQNVYFGILLASSVIPVKCPPTLAKQILEILISVQNQLADKFTVVKDTQLPTFIHASSSMGLYPIQQHLICVESIIKSVDFSRAGDFADASDVTAQLKIRLSEILINGLWTTTKKEVPLYQTTFKAFLSKCMPTIDAQVEFFSNFYVAHVLDNHDINPVFQVKAIRVLNEILSSTSSNISFSLPSLIRILNGLAAPHEAIRQCAIDTMQTLSEAESFVSNYALLVKKILARSEELVLDENQLVLVLYRVFNKTKATHPLLEQIFDLVSNAQTTPVVHALILEMTKHINTAVWCRKIAPSSLKVVSAIETNDRSVIDVQQSTIIRLTLLRFNIDTVAVLRSVSPSWSFLVKCLQSHRALLQSTKGNPVSVAIAALNVLDADIFSALSDEHRTELLKHVLNITAQSPDADVLVAVGKFMRRIELDIANHLNVLMDMQSIDVVPAGPGKQRRKSQTVLILSTDILTTNEWRCGNAFLEFIQNKKQIKNAHLLLPSMFLVLKRCLQFEDQTPVEYSKQLVLSCMLHFCQLISPDSQPKRSLIPDKVFEIELVVQCIRGTQNPQTHHHALQLLSHTAAMIPELVLHNMMHIFTFVGSSVVRRDDAYTYQIISNVIKSIIPTLISTSKRSNADDESAVIPVLRVFADIILDVPEHRRLRLYSDLLNTLDASKYTWMFLAVLFEGYVQNYQQTSNKAPDAAQIKRIEIAVDITNHFDCSTVLETITRMIDFLHKQPLEKKKKATNSMAMDVDITDTQIFNVNSYTDYQLRHFKYIMLQFINRLTEPSSRFVLKMAALDQSATAALKPQFKQIIVTVLQFIGRMHKQNASAADGEKIWKFLLTNCYDILDQVLALIYPEMLLQVVGGLLNKNNIPEVRRKAIELLNKKLQLLDFFATCDPNTLLELLDPLSEIIESIVDESKLIPGTTGPENVSLQQQSLIAIKLLSVQIAKENPTAFRPLLNVLSIIVKTADTIPINVLAQSILCLAEVCSNLRAHAISHLSKFMPALDKILQNQVNKVNTSPNILIYILTGIYKIIETLPLFLSPYLVSLIVSMSTIWSKLSQSAQSTDTQRNITKLEHIWSKLSGVLTLRVLIPMIDQSYQRIVAERSDFGAVGPLMRLLAESLQPLTGTEIQPFQNDLGTFFVLALQFRSNESANISDQLIVVQEDQVIAAFVGMVMKLSESSFRPLYQKLFDWAIRADGSVERAITFYRLSSRIADSLKSLFVLFASDFIQNAADLLAKCTKNTATSAIEYGDNESVQLVSAIVRTLYYVCLHDSQGFMNTHRFETVVAPLVDQLQNVLVLQQADVKEQIPACLAQLAVAVNDDTAWKQLNYQILLKTRNPSADIRLFALGTCVELAKKLGDDFLPLLPETIPFFAEMLEDENPAVEKACQTSVQDLERVLGEPLQKYF